MSYRPHVLIVCRANQCRSPMAELLLRRKVEERGLDIEVSSAGSAADDGRPMHQLAQATLVKHGINPAPWSSRRLTPDLLATADLVLAVDTVELRTIGHALPACATRSFTALQFARLASVMAPLTSASSEEFARTLHDAAAIARGRVSPPESVDIADPIRKGRRAFERCAVILDAALTEMMHAFAGAPAAEVQASG